MEHLSIVLSALDHAGVEHDAERLPNGKVLIMAETDAGGLLTRLVAPHDEAEAREVAVRLVRDIRAA
jgi:hypothetical protein